MVSKKRDITFGLAFGVEGPKLSLTRDNWKEVITQVEAMGYSGIFIPDHFIPQWDPIDTMAAIAARSYQRNWINSIQIYDFPIVRSSLPSDSN